MNVNLFVLSTGFQYYFSTLLIEHLGLTDVAYAMYQPREGIERRATSAASSGPLRSGLSKPATTRPSNTKVGTPGGQIPALRERRTRSSRAAASPPIER